MDIRKFLIISPKKTEKNEPLEEINKIHIVYTDGSTINNGKKGARGGIGVFFQDDDLRNISASLKSQKISYNVAELLGCNLAIKKIINTNNFNINDTIIICTDSQYLINSIEKWSNLWESNGWKRKKNGKLVPIKNLELIKEIKTKFKKYNVQFKHIKAHRSEPNNKNTLEYKDWYGNMMADKLAVMGSKKQS